MAILMVAHDYHKRTYLVNNRDAVSIRTKILTYTYQVKWWQKYVTIRRYSFIFGLVLLLRHFVCTELLYIIYYSSILTC